MVAVSLLFLWVVPAVGATPFADHQRAAADAHGKSVRPTRPTALGPTGTATSATPEFSWTRSRDATGYELVIHQGSHRILTKRGIHRLTWTSRVPLPTGVDLTWRVRGLRNGKPGRYSFSQRFRIVLPDSAKAITAFSFQGLSPPALGTIDEGAHTISVTVPAVADRSHLVATFVTTGVSVAVAGTQQASGETVNDFTHAVTYVVTAADGSTQAYVVTVTAESLSSQKAILAFSFQGLPAPAVGTIDEAAHTIAVSVPPGTDRTRLVATFVTTGVAVSVGGVVQISGLTANDFAGPVTYRVTAADSSAQDYLVTVTMGGAGPVKIGDPYQGGFVAYLFQPGDPGYVPGEPHGLIVAEVDLADAQWSTVTARAVGTTRPGLGTGAANTAAITGQPGCTGGAAVDCEAYAAGGYDDWYLPSQAELEKVTEYSMMFEVFPAGVFYWSSTESGASSAVIVCINDGTRETEQKAAEATVCPMRSF